MSQILDTITESPELSHPPSKPPKGQNLNQAKVKAKVGVKHEQERERDRERKTPIGPLRGFKPAPPTRPISIVHPTRPAETVGPVALRFGGEGSIMVSSEDRYPQPQGETVKRAGRNDGPQTQSQNHNPLCPLATRPPTLTHTPTPNDRTHTHRIFNAGTHVPSTTFYIGPIPPMYPLHEILRAVHSLSPRLAMLDMRSGVVQVVIPFDMNWQQVGECESQFNFPDIIHIFANYIACFGVSTVWMANRVR